MRGQQETILAAVCTLRTHPTADEIYDKLRKDHPRLSLGTVYRNLNALAQKGEILRISAPGGGDRFDFRLDRHEHMLCDICGRAYDVDAEVKIDLREPEISLRGYTLIFHGICAKCAGKKPS
jgi:Fur family peroxide stress response transcriptional regulator